MQSYLAYFFLLCILLVQMGGSNLEVFQQNETKYSLETSFPVQHPLTYTGNGSSLGNRRSVYLDHLESCRKAYPGNECDEFEYYRLMMNLRQPQSMKNYSETGFLKIRAPSEVRVLLDKFWTKNMYKGVRENWGYGNSIANTWEEPTYLVSVDDSGLRGAGVELKTAIWGAASTTLEEWTSQELQPCSMYGVRVYGENSIMLPHVDRLPLVVSAIISVAQDLDEPWPFEMYDHFGVAHNITLQPGDMLLFESASVIHGHPFPLKGRYAAFLFVHFEPTGQAFLHDDTGYHYENRVDRQYRASVKEGIGGQSAESDKKLPPYIQRESPEEQFWRQEHPEGWIPPAEILPPEAHIAAKHGRLDYLIKQLEQEDEGTVIRVLNERDENGWQLLHQGVASGSRDVVELLIQKGATINARTQGGYGETPLRIAEQKLGKTHPIAQYLRDLGALSLGPEL